AIFNVDDYPASCLLAQREWLKGNPSSARAMAKAVLRSIAWIRDHPPEEVLAKIPAESRTGDAMAEIEAIRVARQMYSTDGRIQPQSAEAVRRVLAESLRSVRESKIELSRTYTNDFLP